MSCSPEAENRQRGYCDVHTLRALLSSEVKASGFAYALKAGLWATECCTITAVSQLDEDSTCFQYVPLNVRRTFLRAVKLEAMAGTALTMLL
jgi:hypothetical protein